MPNMVCAEYGAEYGAPNHPQAYPIHQQQTDKISEMIETIAETTRVTEEAEKHGEGRPDPRRSWRYKIKMGPTHGKTR